jgi:hypothetical protein
MIRVPSMTSSVLPTKHQWPTNGLSICAALAVVTHISETVTYSSFFMVYPLHRLDKSRRRFSVGLPSRWDDIIAVPCLSRCK